jgi:hypothetical protein
VYRAAICTAAKPHGLFYNNLQLSFQHFLAVNRPRDFGDLFNGSQLRRFLFACQIYKAFTQRRLDSIKVFARTNIWLKRSESLSASRLVGNLQLVR